MNAAGTIATATPAAIQALNALDKSMQEMHETVAMLEKRLESVLRPSLSEPPAPAPSGYPSQVEPQPAPSRLTSEVMAAASSNERAMNRLHTLMNRLEV